MYECLVEFIYEYHVHVWCLRKSEQGLRCPGTAVTDGYEPLWGAGIEARSSTRATALKN